MFLFCDIEEVRLSVFDLVRCLGYQFCCSHFLSELQNDWMRVTRRTIMTSFELLPSPFCLTSPTLAVCSRQAQVCERKGLWACVFGWDGRINVRCYGRLSLSNYSICLNLNWLLVKIIIFLFYYFEKFVSRKGSAVHREELWFWFVTAVTPHPLFWG